jgi:DNA-directed RNA polymerase specialized sigma24 family protein
MNRFDNPNFSTTNWSVVLAAIQSDPAVATAAFERLCQRYWYPIYAFLRQRGHDTHSAEDLTQGFFHVVLERQTLQRVEREKGRFRTFILTALTNFLHNERDKVQTLKRGGGHQIVSLDGEFAESIYAVEARNGETPETLFERRWAIILVRRVLEELRLEYVQRKNGALFDALQLFFTGEPTATDYGRIAIDLSMEPDTVKVALHRARRRFGEVLRHEVAHTVARPEDIESELRHLLSAIAE